MPRIPKVNLKFKSSVFISLFSNKELLLELYNAIKGTNYKDPNLIDINTLDDAIFMDRANDLSFTIGNKLVVLIEHQSSINENMPLRCLMYMARIYEKIIDSKAIYKKGLVKIPAPEFIVLYNGKEKFPKTKTLKLSNAFKIKGKRIFLELSVRIININKGHNPEIERRSKHLNEYAKLISKAREFGETKEAVTKAVKFCLSHGILLDYLKKHGSEVVNMIFTEWNWDDAISVAKEEGEERGEARGIKLGKARGIKLGEARGMKLGKARGIKLGKAHGIKLGEARGKARGIKLGEVRGKALGIARGEALGMKKVFALLEKGVSLKEAKKRLRG